MNQICYSFFHVSAMGCAGYGLSRLAKLDPKICIVAGVISSVVAQINFEKCFSYYGIDLENINEELKQWFMRSYCTEAAIIGSIAGFFAIFVPSMWKNYPFGNVESIKELAKLVFAHPALLFSCYLTTKVGNYCFLKDRDFKLYGYNSDIDEQVERLLVDKIKFRINI